MIARCSTERLGFAISLSSGECRSTGFSGLSSQWTRSLERPTRIFARERPLKKYTGGNPFKKKNGGAWEVVGRLSRVDLTDGLIEGGELTDISAALSWYINATARVELNYVYASPKNQGAAHIALLRVQYQPW